MHSSDALIVAAAPLGNLADYDVGARRLERVVATSDDLAKRVLRFASSRGDLGLRLERGAAAADGDVLYADEALVIALELARDDVLVCAPRSIPEALAVAHALGNRHLPIQLDGARLVVRYDRLVAELFAGLDVPFVRERRKLAAPFRHAHAPHGHA